MDFNNIFFPPTSRPRYACHHKPAGIYNMFVPMPVRPTHFFTATALITTSMPPNRSFATSATTATYFPIEVPLKFEKLEPLPPSPPPSPPPPSTGSYLFGMFSRILTGIMKTVEDVVAPKKVSKFDLY